MTKVLIIDDDQAICKMLSGLVNQMGHRAVYEHTLAAGLNEVRSNPYDVVLLDVYLPDGSGLDILPKIREARSSPEVIIMTGFGVEDGAEIAIKSGAWDYIQKTDSPKNIILPLQRVLQYRDEKGRVKTPVLLDREGIIGESRQIKSCLALVAHAAGNDSNVIITGDTGTGKEIFALAIHKNSGRSGKGFISVDCGALTETLAESILFGHAKGAFTGADKEQTGLIKLADGGTLFLDEVGELPMSIQSTFLRVLQERRFRPVGGKQEVKSDFKLIAATNRKLEQMIETGKFRKDLLFRIKSITIDLPLLRERKNDIHDLALYYTKKLCKRHGLQIKGFSPEFIETLLAYDWPGNVRELINILEHVFSTAQDEPILHPVHLPQKMRIKQARSSVSQKIQNEAKLDKSTELSKSFPDLRELIERTEREYFQSLISHTGGNIKEACRISGLSRTRLYERLKKYNIRRQI